MFRSVAFGCFAIDFVLAFEWFSFVGVGFVLFVHVEIRSLFVNSFSLYHHDHDSGIGICCYYCADGNEIIKK